MTDELRKNIAFARELYDKDPAAFKDLAIQIKAMEPTLLNFMEVAMKAPAATPLDVQTLETLEELAIDLDNIGSRLRDLMRQDKGNTSLAIILERLKAASRHIVDASDDLIEIRAAQRGP